MIHESKQFRVMDRSGDIAATRSGAKDAWAVVDKLSHGPYAPHTVAQLVDVPRPAPPRPTLAVGGYSVTWAHTLYHVSNGLVYTTAVSTVYCSDVWGNPDADVLALIQLRADSDAWDAAHGGKAND